MAKQPRPLIAHLDRIEAELASLTPAQRWAFGVACAERQWPIYGRAALGRPWDRRPALRGVLDRMWDWVGGSTPRPHDLEAVCNDAQFVDNTGERPDLTYELANDGEKAADDVLIVLWAMAVGIDEDGTGACYSAASQAMSTVEAFVYDHELPDLNVSAVNDLVVDKRELVQNAMRQQNEDLALVARTADTPAVVGELRKQASSQSILMDRWYPNRVEGGRG